MLILECIIEFLSACLVVGFVVAFCALIYFSTREVDYVYPTFYKFCEAKGMSARIDRGFFFCVDKDGVVRQYDRDVFLKD